MSVIEIKHIFKDYFLDGGMVQPVLKDVNLSVNEGEFVSIMGPSGSGKSTFMNILGCLDRPTKGEYWLNDRNVAELNSKDLAFIRGTQLGFVFQGFNLLQRRTIIDNVTLPLIYTGVDKDLRRERGTKLLESVNLRGYEDHFPNQLSGGMQQRVAIARALVNNPSVIFADEPTGNLDTKTSNEIMDLFVALNKHENITIVLVTHEPDIAEYTKRLVFTKDGVKEFDGDIEEAKKKEIL